MDETAAILSVVVPAYNEEAVLAAFHQRLAAVLDGLGQPAEVLYVNDGSTDRTRTLIEGRPGQGRQRRTARPVA